MRYVYLGARGTAPELIGQPCDPVRRSDGKCIVGRGAALVRFKDGSERVVVRRRLRVVVAVLMVLAMTPSIPSRAAQDRHLPKPMAYCRMQGTPGWSRTDIENEIGCAVDHFQVPGGYGTVIAIALRETGGTLNPYAVNPTTHACGLYQHLPRYWPGRVANFRAHRPRFGVGTNCFNVRANVLTSVWMMWHYGMGPWR